MSIFGKTKGAAKFVFVKMPASILGINTLRSNNQTIKALYETLNNPLCPKCFGGVLAVQDSDSQGITSPDMNYTWACNQCHFMLLGGRDKRSILPTVMAMHQERSLSLFDGMEDDERKSYVRQHALHSRLFFGAAITFFIGFCYMLLSGTSLLISINWLVLAFCMFIFGLKKSYRSWQVENGVLYVKGAFKSWFSNAQWFR